MPLMINGERIDEAIIDQEFSSIKSAYEARSGNTCCCDRDDEFRGYARENVIARVLLVQEAIACIDTLPDQEIDTALKKVKDEHGGDQQFYAAYGITPDQEQLVRDDIALNLRVEKLVDQRSDQSSPPSEEQLRAFYDEHLGNFMEPERVRAMHILKNPPRAEEREAVYNELRTLRGQLVDGADFERLARTTSDKAREAQEAANEGRNHDGGDGIDLGWFQRGELLEEFELVAFSLRVGEVSPVFSTPYGFHIVKLTERNPAAPKPFSEVSDEVRQDFLDERRADDVRKIVKQLEAKANIEIVDETNDENV